MVDRGKVGFPTLFRGRTNTNENHFASPDGFARIRSVRDVPLSGRAFQYFLEVFLVDRHLPGFQQVDAFVIDIRAENFVTSCRQAGSRHQPDVTTPDYGQTHKFFSLLFSSLNYQSEGADSLSRCLNRHWGTIPGLSFQEANHGDRAAPGVAGAGPRSTITSSLHPC